MERYRQSLNSDDHAEYQRSSRDFLATVRYQCKPLAEIVTSRFKGFLGRERNEGQRDLPLHRIPSASSTQPELGQVAGIPTPDPLFLLLCRDQGRWATRLIQLDLVTLQATSDQTLFRALRHEYESIRGK